MVQVGDSDPVAFSASLLRQETPSSELRLVGNSWHDVKSPALFAFGGEDVNVRKARELRESVIESGGLDDRAALSRHELRPGRYLLRLHITGDVTDLVVRTAERTELKPVGSLESGFLAGSICFFVLCLLFTRPSIAQRALESKAFRLVGKAFWYLSFLFVALLIAEEVGGILDESGLWNPFPDTLRLVACLDSWVLIVTALVFIHLCDYVFLLKFCLAFTEEDEEIRTNPEARLRTSFVFISVYFLFDSVLALTFSDPTTMGRLSLYGAMILQVVNLFYLIKTYRSWPESISFSNIIWLMFFLIFTETLITNVLFFLVILDRSRSLYRRYIRKHLPDEAGLPWEHDTLKNAWSSRLHRVNFALLLGNVIPVILFWKMSCTPWGGASFERSMTISYLYMVPILYWMLLVRSKTEKVRGTFLGLAFIVMGYYFFTGHFLSTFEWRTFRPDYGGVGFNPVFKLIALLDAVPSVLIHIFLIQMIVSAMIYTAIEGRRLKAIRGEPLSLGWNYFAYFMLVSMALLLVLLPGILSHFDALILMVTASGSGRSFFAISALIVLVYFVNFYAEKRSLGKRLGEMAEGLSEPDMGRLSEKCPFVNAFPPYASRYPHRVRKAHVYLFSPLFILVIALCGLALSGYSKIASPDRHLVWEVTSNETGRIGLPVILDGSRAYCGWEEGHHLFCLDKGTGETLWQCMMEGPLASSFRSSSRALFVVQGDAVCSISKKDGAILWNRSFEEHYLQTFIRRVSDRYVEVIWHEGQKSCKSILAAETGETVVEYKTERRSGYTTPLTWIVWVGEHVLLEWDAVKGTVKRRDLPGNDIVWERRFHNQGRFHLTATDEIAVLTLSDRLEVMDVETGKTRWDLENLPDEKAQGCGVILSPDSEFVLVDLVRRTEGRVHPAELRCLDAGDGSRRWVWPHKDSWKDRIILSDVILYHHGHTGADITAIDRRTGRVVWRQGLELMAGKDEATVLFRAENHQLYRHVFVVNSNLEVAGIDCLSGKKLWRYRLVKDLLWGDSYGYDEDENELILLLPGKIKKVALSGE